MRGRPSTFALMLLAVLAGCSDDSGDDDGASGGSAGGAGVASGGRAGGAGRGGAANGGTMGNPGGGRGGASGGAQSTGGSAGRNGTAGDAGNAGSGEGGDDSGSGATGGGGSSGGGDAGGAGAGPSGEGEVRAFPGAEGFGAMVTGGRGGRVLKVTTLAASGPGSLQAALDEEGPRIIVFDVSGVIEADIVEITNGDVTIAGQTAPGGGITIAGRLYGAYDGAVGNIIIRHVRIRPLYDGSDGEQFDGIQLSLNHHFILDHVSVAFGVDETVDLYEATDATIQWSTIESSGTEGHPEGEHNYGLINGPDGARLSVHHNLFAHHKNRTPAIATGPADVSNNVVYNVRTGFVHNNPASGQFNLIGNYFRTGESDTLVPFYFDDENDPAAGDLAYFLAGNVLEGTNSECPAGSVDDPWTQCDYDPYRDASFVAGAAFDFTSGNAGYRAVTTSRADAARDAVLERAGAFPRDVVTERSVAETLAGTGDWGARAPADLFEGLSARTPPADADADGMADAWESENGLDPSDGEDHSTTMPSGYTAIEEYVNGLADDLIP